MKFRIKRKTKRKENLRGKRRLFHVNLEKKQEGAGDQTPAPSLILMTS